MFNKSVGLALIALSAAAILTGCGASREVEVAGEVSAPASLSLNSEIALQFIDVDEDKAEIVHHSTLAKPGAFTESVPLAGDTVLIRAIADANKDQKCSAGEAWGQIEVKVSKSGEEEMISGVALSLGTAACPPAAE